MGFHKDITLKYGQGKVKILKVWAELRYDLATSQAKKSFLMTATDLIWYRHTPENVCLGVTTLLFIVGHHGSHFTFIHKDNSPGYQA